MIKNGRPQFLKGAHLPFLKAEVPATQSPLENSPSWLRLALLGREDALCSLVHASTATDHLVKSLGEGGLNKYSKLL